MESKLLSSIKKINLFSALTLISVCIFPYNWIQQWALIIFFSTYIIEFLTEQKWKNFKWEKSKWTFVLFLVFYSLTIIYIPFEQDTQYLGQTLEYRLAFLAIGLIGLFGYNRYYKLDYFVYVIIATSLILTFYIFSNIEIIDFIHSSHKNDIFINTRSTLVNTHMMYNYYINISIAFCYYLYKTKSDKYLRAAAIVIGLFFYFLMLNSEGRTGFLIANAIVSMILFYTLYQWNRKIALISVVVVVPVMLVLAINHPKIQSSEHMQKDLRLSIWHNAIEVISEKPLLGHGASSGKIAFIKKAEGDPILVKIFPDITLAHPHNQYLQMMIEFGIIGISMLLLLNIVPIFLISKNLKFPFFLFIFITMGQLVTEIYKYAVPIVLFTLWVSVFFNEASRNALKQR